MDRTAWFRVLAGVALADGRLEAGEQALLLRCASWLGITRQQAGQILLDVRARGAGNSASAIPPGERERLFKGVLDLVLADGRISEQENKCLRALAATFGLETAVARRLMTEALKRWQVAASAASSLSRSSVSAVGPGAPGSGPHAAPARPAQALPPGTVIGGKLRVLELLGEGGFGAVFKARHEDLDEDVALKVLLRGAGGPDDQSEKRFLREVKLARSFAHRYAVPIREFGRDAKHGLYFTMDLVPGRTLEQVVDGEGPQPAERVVRLAAQALEALDEAHRAGIVHRDLKPANLMITKGATDAEEVRVLDFGVAKAVSSARGAEPKLTRAGALVGTPTYMSPEQVGGGEVDARSDLYSLAVVIYEALSGCLPYTVDPDTIDVQQAMLFQIMAEAPRDLRDALPAAPAPLAAALARALEKEPAARYADAQAFREALLAAVAAPPAPEPGKPAPGRLSGWLKGLGGGAA